MAEDKTTVVEEPVIPQEEPASEPDESKPDETVEGLNAEIEELGQKSEAEKGGLVEQIKALRIKLHEAAEAAKVKPESTPSGTSDDVEAKVMSVLAKQRAEEAKGNRIAALRMFWEKYPEYSPENDLAGLKMEKVGQALNRINSSSHMPSEVLKDYEDALILMGVTPKKTDTSKMNDYAGTPGSTSTPRTVESNKLTPDEDKLRREKGWTVDKFLKMKEKYPDIVRPYRPL